MTEMHRNQLAQRIYDITDPWDRDEATPENIAHDIKTDPLAVIEYLINLVEDLQA